MQHARPLGTLLCLQVLADQDSQRLAREAQRLRASGNPDALGDLMLFLPVGVSFCNLQSKLTPCSIWRLL